MAPSPGGCTSRATPCTCGTAPRARAEVLGIGTVARHAGPGGATEAEVVLSVLTGTEAVRQVYLGEHGALEAGGDRVYVDITTASPEVHVEVAEAAAATRRGLRRGAGAGQHPGGGLGQPARCSSGATTASIERARPVLEALGEVRHVGPARGRASASSWWPTPTWPSPMPPRPSCWRRARASGLDVEAVFAVLVRFVPYLEARRAGFLERRYEPVLFRVADLVEGPGPGRRRCTGRSGSDTPIDPGRRRPVHPRRARRTASSTSRRWPRSSAARDPGGAVAFGHMELVPRRRLELVSGRSHPALDPGDRQASRCRARRGQPARVRQRRDPLPLRRLAARQRRLHRADALGPRERLDHGAAHHDRRRQAGVGQAHHRGVPVLRVLAPGPQGHRARAHHRQARGRHVPGGGRRPRGQRRPALGTDPGLLRRPLRPPDRHAGARRGAPPAGHERSRDRGPRRRPGAGGRAVQPAPRCRPRLRAQAPAPGHAQPGRGPRRRG